MAEIMVYILTELMELQILEAEVVGEGEILPVELVVLVL